jgi:hypothetical protein
MNEIEFNISRIIIANAKHTKNIIFLLRNVKDTITFYWTHYTSVRIVNEIKIYLAKKYCICNILQKTFQVNRNLLS